MRNLHGYRTPPPDSCAPGSVSAGSAAPWVASSATAPPGEPQGISTSSNSVISRRDQIAVVSDGLAIGLTALKRCIQPAGLGCQKSDRVVSGESEEVPGFAAGGAGVDQLWAACQAVRSAGPWKSRSASANASSCSSGSASMRAVVASLRGPQRRASRRRVTVASPMPKISR